MRRLVAALLLPLLVVAVSACGSPGSGPADDPAPTPVFDALADPGAIPGLAREHLGEQVTVRRVSLNENGFSMEVRDPAKPANIDRYRSYRGTWDSDPVSVSDIESFDETTFGIGAVNWKAIPGLQEQALAGLDLEDETSTSVSVDRIAGDPPRIYINVSGSRGSGSLIADGQGRNVQIRRH